jgi:flagellar protein FliL
MSDEAVGEAAPPKKSGRAKLFLAIGAALLLLTGGGAAAFVMLTPPAEAPGDGHATASETDHADIVFVDLPELLVNLNVTGQRLRFLKIATAVEVAGEEEAEAVRQFVPRILDSFHLYLRAITPEELQGAEGVYRIKEELLVRTNEAVRPV